MTKCELETELIMQNANLLRYQFILHSVLLTRSKSTVRSEKGKTLVGQLNCVRLVVQIKGLVGKFRTTLYGKNAMKNRTIVSSFVWTQYRNVTDGRNDSCGINHTKHNSFSRKSR